MLGYLRGRRGWVNVGLLSMLGCLRRGGGLGRLGIKSLLRDEPTFSPRKTAGRMKLSFVQIDQSGICLPRLSK